MKNILLVDDEKSFLRSFAEYLDTYNGIAHVITAEHGRKAVEILRTAEIDLVITDLNMPVMDGFELLAYMSKNHPKTPVIVLSAADRDYVKKRLHGFKVFQFYEKPLDLSEVAQGILAA